MAKNKGWWDLSLTNNRMDDLSDCDREHVAKLIIEGFTSGEIVQDEIEEEPTCNVCGETINDIDAARDCCDNCLLED